MKYRRKERNIKRSTSIRRKGILSRRKRTNKNITHNCIHKERYDKEGNNNHSVKNYILFSDKTLNAQKTKELEGQNDAQINDDSLQNTKQRSIV
jgi:hypothetical protein